MEISRVGRAGIQSASPLLPWVPQGRCCSRQGWGCDLHVSGCGDGQQERYVTEASCMR